MTRRSARTRATAAVAALSLAAACSHVAPAPAAPPQPPSAAAIAASAWPVARTAAEQAAIAGRFQRADSVLRAFSASYPGTEASAEALFFRAFYKLDPAVEGPAALDATREARAALDAYIAGGPLLAHYAEALTLRRLTGHLDSLHTIVPEIARPVATPAGVRDTLRLREEELARLRVEREQMQAELDRLRRRLRPRP